MSRRIKLTVSYDGTEFHGWQVQPGLPTIQGTLEEIFAQVEGSPVPVTGSGRTDAGVHALAQVAAVTIENPIPCENLVKALNRLLPQSIRVLQADEVGAEFHPRFDAVAKTYEYRMFRDAICPPFERLYVYHRPYPLDEEAMCAAAPLLQGEHDFTAFAAADEKDELGHSKVRRVFASEMRRDGARLVYRVRGSGFLKHMVRNIMGVLLEIGKGNLTEADLRARLEPGCGTRPGPAAPARGLFLMGVEY
jgi:tRNA pseudouridine38-40 synthase